MTFQRTSGGTAVTDLGYGIKVNPKSGLTREWITVHDTAAPAQVTAPIGVRTVYRAGRYGSGEYQYVASIPVTVRDSVAALEIRFVLFDIWGEFVRTLSATEIEDFPAGATRVFTPRWDVWSENEVSEHYASLGYIARVRLTDGRVYEANYEPIVEEGRKFSQRFTPADLDPSRRPPVDSSAPRR